MSNIFCSDVVLTWATSGSQQMASISLDKRTGMWFCYFRFGGKAINKSTSIKDEKKVTRLPPIWRRWASIRDGLTPGWATRLRRCGSGISTSDHWLTTRLNCWWGQVGARRRTLQTSLAPAILDRPSRS